MRSCLVLVVLVLLTNCTPPNVASCQASYMSETIVKEMKVSLTGPQTLPLSVVRRGSPSYDPERNFFTITLENQSSETRTMPFDEIGQNVVLIYRNPQTKRGFTDNRTPPPDPEPPVEKIGPGVTRSFQVVFDYPGSIAKMEKGVAVLQFCVKWQSEWLRKSAYAPSAYDWNESFELCREIRITDE